MIPAPTWIPIPGLAIGFGRDGLTPSVGGRWWLYVGCAGVFLIVALSNDLGAVKWLKFYMRTFTRRHPTTMLNAI